MERAKGGCNRQQSSDVRYRSWRFCPALGSVSLATTASLGAGNWRCPAAGIGETSGAARNAARRAAKQKLWRWRTGGSVSGCWRLQKVALAHGAETLRAVRLLRCAAVSAGGDARLWRCRVKARYSNARPVWKGGGAGRLYCAHMERAW